MKSPFAKEWDEKIIVRMPYMQLSLLKNLKQLILPLIAALALSNAVNASVNESLKEELNTL